jgi:rRNA biogenesis protein RRP5
VSEQILSTDPGKNRIVLTLKRQLMESELPIVASISDATVGKTTTAVVTKILDSGVLVDFFGGLRALIPAAEAA